MVYLVAVATGGERKEALATNVGGMEGRVNVVSWKRFPLMVALKHHVICKPPIASIFAGLPYNEVHVSKHVSYLIRVGLGHHCNIGKGGHPGKKGPHFPLLKGFGRVTHAGSVSMRSANTKLSGSSSRISTNSSAWMRRVSFPGIGAKLLASWKGGVLGKEAGGSGWLCFEVLHTIPVIELVGSQELTGSVRVGAPSEAVDSSGIFERERGVRVKAGDKLLVGAVMSESAPKHENKGREGWEGAQIV